MQNPNNNQVGQRPPFPGAVRIPQLNPQNGAPNPNQSTIATPSSSPFADPPPSSTELKSPINGMVPMSQGPNVRPILHSRPPMPLQPNQSPSAGLPNRPPMMMPRPPSSATCPALRPPMPSQAPSGNPSSAIRPPPPSSLPPGPGNSPQTNPMPQMTRLPLPQMTSPGARPSFPMPQYPPMHGQTPQFNRPPMPPQVIGGPRPPMPPQGILGPRPPMPLQGTVGPRPPMPPQGTVGPRPPMPPQGTVGPRPPMPPQGILGPRPPMPQSAVPSSSPFASPPAGPHSQSIRPQIPPTGMRPPVPGQMRPPMSTGNPPIRPPMSTGNVLATAPLRPPMSSGNVPSTGPMRPPMSFAQPGPHQQYTPAPIAYNGRPPMPMPQHGIPPAQYGSQVPHMASPSMRYPSGPGYMQQQQNPAQGMPPQNNSYPQSQQAGYPQSAPTQQHYPSYPQSSNMANTQQYPTQGFSGGNGVAPPPAAPKVNPAAIPSVVSVLEADELRFKETGLPYYTFSSVVENAPPLPTNKSVSIIDDGNSSPQFIRVTMNHIPVSEEVCQNTKIPLSLLIQPFSSTPQSEIPLVDFGVSGPLRCNRCRAYINSHVQFIKGGRYFVCNMCDMANDVPEEYYANLDMSGKRIDLDLRSELKFGTVDFVASKEYSNKPAGKPHLLFVLDSSRAAVGSGAFQAAIESIRAFALNSQATQFYSGMAILIHDRSLTFYTLREGRNEPQVLVVGDIFDPFVPLHANDLYFDPVKCASGLTVLLNHLCSSITLETRPVDSCFGAAVSVALESLKVRGGRAVFYQTTLPSYGPGALKNRESGAPGSVAAPADKANPLLFPQGDYYTKLAAQAAEQGVSMSIVSTPAAHIDLATIGVLANTTSGSLFLYSRFSPQQQTSRLVGDVVGLLSSSFAFDCLVRIRCNSGLQVRKHYGHFHAESNGHDLSFGSISSDQSFAALLEYDSKLSEKTRAAFQVAVLHTDAFSGQRRIRVLNLALPCTSSIQTIFKMAELDSILAFYIKKNVSQILEAPSSAFPASFSAKCSNILAAYRKYCAANMSSGQLILPDSLKLFPVMTLAIHKDPAFNEAPKSADARWHAIHRLSDMSLSLTICHFYPQLFPLSNVLEYEEILPACIRLSREHVTRDGIYLMNNGDNLSLYVGDSVDPSVLREIFGVDQLNAVTLTSTSSSGSNLPMLQNSRSAKLRQIITVLRSQNAPRHLNLRLIRQSVDIAEDAEFAGLLIEDASSLSPSYVDFLCRIHSTIQHTITQSASLSLAERTSMLSFLQ